VSRCPTCIGAGIAGQSKGRWDRLLGERSQAKTRKDFRTARKRPRRGQLSHCPSP
jgi:hypothetical protein